MMQLWIGLALLTLLAIAVIFWPLVKAHRAENQLDKAEDRKSQNIDIFREREAELQIEKQNGNLTEEDYQALRTELERNLLIDAQEEPKAINAVTPGKGHWLTVTLIALMIPAAGMGLYAEFGRAPDLAIAYERQANPNQQPTLEEALGQLKQELANNPENPEGWFLLATTNMSIGDYAAGVSAFENVLKYLPEDAPQYPGVMGQYAQALYFQANGEMTDAVKQQIEATLARDPDEMTVLGLLGINAYESGRYAEAIGYWKRALINADGEAAESLEAGIARAEQQLGISSSDNKADHKPVQVKLSIAISDELKAQAEPDMPVYVFARPEGGRMPLAAIKLKVSDLPRIVILDDSQAMMPEAKLSGADVVEVSARVSLHGEPRPQAGDLYGTLSSVKLSELEGTLTLRIDQVAE